MVLIGAVYNIVPYLAPLERCITTERINNTRNTVKIIFAILTNPIAIPVKPKIAAMTAITRKVKTHANILLLLYKHNEEY